MTQLNDILIDGADDVAVEVPSQLKKAVGNVEVKGPQSPAAPISEPKPEEKKTEALAASHGKTNEIIARKMAEEANKKAAVQVQPSVTELMVGFFI